MFSTDNLFFLIIFIIPGAVYILFNRYLRSVPMLEKDETIRLSGALLFSFVVFGLTSFILQNLYMEFMSQNTIFDNTNLLLFIVFSNVLLSLSLCLVWVALKPIVITLPINLINKILKRPQESENELVWDYLFETNNLIDINCCIATIEKDDTIVSGQIIAFPASITDKMNFIVTNTQYIENLLEEDKQKREEDKIFQVNYVYFDAVNGLKITFYDVTKYKTIS